MAASVDLPESETNYSIFAFKTDGLTFGLAYLGLLRDCRTLFFVYIAINVDHRGRFGLKQLVRLVVETERERAREKGVELQGVVFEVERPELAVDEEDRRFREKRLRAYGLLGAQTLSRNYIQPALGPGKEPVPLILMMIPFDSEFDIPGIVKCFYRSVFGLSEEDPMVKDAIQ